MDTAKYAYEIQVAGKGAKGLACTKFAASYRKSLDVKDVSGEIGISSQKAFDAKISGHANAVEVFGGFYNRVPAPWYQHQSKLRSICGSPSIKAVNLHTRRAGTVRRARTFCTGRGPLAALG
jgi:hypothetical protein